MAQSLLEPRRGTRALLRVSADLARLFAHGSMEPLWSPAGAISGNRWQVGRPRKRRKQAKSVATGCHRLRATFHGKEGVDRSSPSEGSANVQQIAAFSSPICLRTLACGRCGALMEPSGQEARLA